MTNRTSFVCGMLVVPLAMVALGAALAGTASVPNTFYPDTTARSDEVNENFEALRDAVNDNVPRRTVLKYSGVHGVNVASYDYEHLFDIGVFTKHQADTDVLITWVSHIHVSALWANFQVRVDDVSSGPDIGDGAAIIRNGPNDAPCCVVALFEGLADGDHTVSIWVRGEPSATQAENDSNYHRYAIVEESFSH